MGEQLCRDWQSQILFTLYLLYLPLLYLQYVPGRLSLCSLYARNEYARP
jgi:hypothetical protein